MTYSIVARDEVTGELGVAVQSHWFSVGSVVSWARPGVGAVATQSILEVSYGPRMLELMEGGADPRTALNTLTGEDAESRYRQVAAVSAVGEVAVHTGEDCIRHAGHVSGEGFSAQANMMASPEVWPAMAAAFQDASGPLARRLLAALEAAETAGGDVRGRQSAALLVVPAEGPPWATLTDLRVEDHPDPVAELGRLVSLREAYDLANEGDEMAGAGRHPEAGELYRRAAQLAPGNLELRFWSGLALAQAGSVEAGAAQVAEVIEAGEGWRELLARLGPDIAPAAEAVRLALDVEPADA